MNKGKILKMKRNINVYAICIIFIFLLCGILHAQDRFFISHNESCKSFFFNNSKIFNDNQENIESDPQTIFFTISISPIVIPTLSFSMGTKIRTKNSSINDEIQLKIYYGKLIMKETIEAYGLEFKILRFKNFGNSGFFTGFNLGVVRTYLTNFTKKKVIPTLNLEIGYSFNPSCRISMDLGYKIFIINLYFTLVL